MQALDVLFQQFIGGNEKIEFMEYLGEYGFIINVLHSFICVTEKRIISLKIGSFGKIIYQDAFIEDLNSSVIYQPSILGLYIWSILLIIFMLVFSVAIVSYLNMLFGYSSGSWQFYLIGIISIILTLAFTVFLLLPVIVKLYYKINKCGLVFSIKEGISVYVFVNRNRLTRANVMWRIGAQLREERVRLLHG